MTRLNPRATWCVLLRFLVLGGAARVQGDAAKLASCPTARVPSGSAMFSRGGARYAIQPTPSRSRRGEANRETHARFGRRQRDVYVVTNDVRNTVGHSPRLFAITRWRGAPYVAGGHAEKRDSREVFPGAVAARFVSARGDTGACTTACNATCHGATHAMTRHGSRGNASLRQKGTPGLGRTRPRATIERRCFRVSPRLQKVADVFSPSGETTSLTITSPLSLSLCNHRGSTSKPVAGTRSSTGPRPSPRMCTSNFW